MSTSFFYLQAERNNANSDFIKELEAYAEREMKQVYVVNKPLGDSKYGYDYDKGLIVLIPEHKIMILNFGQDEELFEDYHLDVVEDLSSISDKYQYKSVLGRSRKWSREIVSYSRASMLNAPVPLDELLEANQLRESLLRKKVELLISLFTGSINDIDRVKEDIPENILDKIKQKIVLFDGEQTRFIYQEINKKLVRIQGLSGTGKTELLLHKVKDLYINKPDTKLLFTCHNKILAASLKKRIPDFFNFMKVEQQIKWEERLWCVHAWGSQNNINTGAYRYICGKYSIPFYTFSYSRPFAKLCKLAIEQLKSIDIEEIGYAFDYVLIDESQDFPLEFVELCQMVTKDTVYVAGDIFQSIFDENIVSEVKPNFLLSKCYRTDPKTLMFAHGLGMGLFEDRKLRWLNDDQWEACGYEIDKIQGDNVYRLKREPLRRFEDLVEHDIQSMNIIKTSWKVPMEVKVVELIEKLRLENPTITPDDIGVVFTGGNKSGYALADVLEQIIEAKFGWKLNKAYESKYKVKGELFISNKNNVKGLEFPFVICISEHISNAKHERNALYMLLTRSFIQSFLLVPETINPTEDAKLASLEAGLRIIEQNDYIEVVLPSDDEKEALNTNIDYDANAMSAYDIAEAVFDELDVPSLWRDPIRGMINQIDAETIDYDSVKDLVTVNMEALAIHNQ
jgi:superfamily I DNA and RNA helicase